MESHPEDQIGLREFLAEAELDQYFEHFRDILKIAKTSQLKYVNNDDLTQIGLSKPEQRRYKKLFSKYFHKNYIERIKRLLTTKKHDAAANVLQDSMHATLLNVMETTIKVPTKHIIPVDAITINKELGTGEFGVVQQGTWTNENQRIQVAIKCLGKDKISSNSNEFLKEAAVMHSIEHPNVVRLFGVVLHPESLMLVTELAPLRSLLECLRELDLRPHFPISSLCNFAIQICDGMTYLESKRLIHRDLAARNVLVFSKNKVKISDFGLSRALGAGKDYYQSNYNLNLKLPVAWCAVECILYLRFTSASDVWAFGVCLWEMFSYGFQPWAACSGQQILESIDAPNFQRLERPQLCPEKYYQTMLNCWNHDPQSRPKFKDLSTHLRDIKPEQLEAIIDMPDSECKKSNYLEYKAGNIITVIGKSELAPSKYWYGALQNGNCGLFDPNNMKPHSEKKKPLSIASSNYVGSSSLMPSMRSSFLRSDAKRHTYTGKRCIERSMISGPQGDLKHTSHVGLDGAYFGDLSFLDPAICQTPKQVVSPYRPSEDLEVMPLINPSSPSHLTGGISSTPPFTMLNPEPGTSRGARSKDEDEVDLGVAPPQYDLSQGESNNSKKRSGSKSSEAGATRLILDKIKITAINKTMSRSFKGLDSERDNDEDSNHQYTEISDTDTECGTTEKYQLDEAAAGVGSPNQPSSDTEFSASLIGELDTMFRNLNSSSPSELPIGPFRRVNEHENINKYHSLNKDKKKTSGVVKPMSAHEKKTLETAVAMANEITKMSMNSSDKSKPSQSPVEKSKFSLKFTETLKSLTHSHDNDKDAKKKTFTQEAQSVPDLQSTITEDCRKAYASLIEQPTTVSLIDHLSHNMHSTSPRDFYSLHRPPSHLPTRSGPMIYFDKRASCSVQTNPQCTGATSEVVPFNYTFDGQNPLPVPPRYTKPKLVERTRHVRKYPLVAESIDDLPPDDPFFLESYLQDSKTAYRAWVFIDSNKRDKPVYVNCCSHQVRVHHNNVKAIEYPLANPNNRRAIQAAPPNNQTYQPVELSVSRSSNRRDNEAQQVHPMNLRISEVPEAQANNVSHIEIPRSSVSNYENIRQGQDVVDGPAVQVARIEPNANNPFASVNPFNAEKEPKDEKKPATTNQKPQKDKVPRSSAEPIDGTNIPKRKPRAVSPDEEPPKPGPKPGPKTFALRPNLPQSGPKPGPKPKCNEFENKDVTNKPSGNATRVNEDDFIDNEEGLRKDTPDHVSVEDLLAFADKKPCGRDRGIESDEVRIIRKVLTYSISPEEAVEMLDACNWEIHLALKLAQVRVAASSTYTVEDCQIALEAHANDATEAIASLADPSG